MGNSTSVLPKHQDEHSIEEHLNELLNSKPFSHSRRSRDFLRYVVEEALAGRGAEIKERNIATDVFFRSSNFDAQNDSIVRVTASEVRKRLICAYKVGLKGPVRIELPIGTYEPVFRWDSPDALPCPPESQQPKQAEKLHLYSIRSALLIGGLAIVVLSVFLMWNRRRTLLDKFWEPFCHQASTVLISLPAPTVFTFNHPDDQLFSANQARIPLSKLSKHTKRFVGTGAAIGAAQFAKELTLHHQDFIIKFGTDVAFADLNHSAAILLGTFSSPLTMEITKELRFRLQKNGTENCIIDSKSSDRWCMPNGTDAESTGGYALVCRLLHTQSGYPILIVGGITAPDTQAAVRFLSTEVYFDTFVKSIPHGWSKSDFEIVLHSSVYKGISGIPTVVASTFSELRNEEVR